MPEFSLEALAATLNAYAPQRHAWCVALSGGADSTVLLHAMAALRARYPQWSLRAVHVDHQLQPQSAAWAEHCAAAARALGVPCELRRVQVIGIDQEGVEAAARRARYAALAETLQPGEVLVTAHHADDQLETLLIALLRGSGVPGLAGMPACTPFAAGLHARPLLEFERTELQSWGVARGIAHVDDPSNRDRRFDRNFLRNEIIPLLKTRWPSAARSVGRAAGHFAEADELLAQLADADLELVAQGECLRVSCLRAFDPARRRLLWRRWIQRRGLLMPSTRSLQALDHDMLYAAADRTPCVRWPGAAVHRHGDLLYAMSAVEEWPRGEFAWSWNQPLVLPTGFGELAFDKAEPASNASAGIAIAQLPDSFTVCFRTGGERIRLPNAAHHSELKKLLQGARILPWWRPCLPLVYAGDMLVAVADLWISAEFAAPVGEAARRIVWRDRPQLFPPSTS